MAGRAGRRLIPDPARYSGRLWRILFSDWQRKALDPARHPEGRFHHDGQRALYASPTPDAAGVAIDSYYRPGDPPRIILPLWLDGARLLDFRDPATSAALGASRRRNHRRLAHRSRGRAPGAQLAGQRCSPGRGRRWDHLFFTQGAPALARRPVLLEWAIRPGVAPGWRSPTLRISANCRRIGFLSPETLQSARLMKRHLNPRPVAR